MNKTLALTAAALTSMLILSACSTDTTSLATDTSDIVTTPYETPTPAPVEVVEPTSEPTAEVKAAPSKSDYDSISGRTLRKIVKNADDHAGDHVIVYAKVWQFDGATGPEYFLADVAATNISEKSYDGEDTYFYADDTGGFTGSESTLDDVVEDDIVKIWATIEGSQTYERAAGGTNTVPKFHVDYIKVIGSTA